MNRKEPTGIEEFKQSTGTEAFKGIDPSEMSKLRVIAYLTARGSGEYAQDIAQAITGKSAIEVADVLINKKRPRNKEAAEIARDLRGSVAIPQRESGR